MFFRNIRFKEQLPVAVGRENVFALTIKIGMYAFLCSSKSEISLIFHLKTLLHVE